MAIDHIWRGKGVKVRRDLGGNREVRITDGERVISVECPVWVTFLDDLRAGRFTQPAQ